ncbi:MAG: hypothetical protein ACLFWD_02465 [Anaerolineales bacterium]
MTSVREAIKRLLRRIVTEHAPEADRPRPDYSYRIYWAKTVREWSPARRKQINESLIRLIETEEFQANLYQRQYQLAGLDDSRHAGASLIALKEVIEGFDQFEREEKENEHE